MRIASWNTQGIISTDRLPAILEDLSHNNIHVALIQETNLSPDDPGNRINHLQVPDDWTLSTPNTGVTPSNRGKGVAILVHPSLTHSCSDPRNPIMSPVAEIVCESFELLACRIASIIVVNIYVHASVDPDYDALYDAVQSVSNSNNNNIIIGGDFNHPQHRHFVERNIMAPLGFQPCYDTSQPPATRGSNPLDLMFWKGEDISTNNMALRERSLSDHEIISVDVHGTSVASLLFPETNPVMIRWDQCPCVPVDSLPMEQRSSWCTFVEKCQSALITACKDPTDPITAMTASLNKIAAERFGTKEYRTKNRVPWWNKQLTHLHRRVRKAHKRSIRTGISARQQQSSKAKYESILNTYKQACKKARNKAMKDFQAKFNPTDMNRTWRATDAARGKRHPKYLRRVATDPDAAAGFWQTIFTDHRFPALEPQEPQSNRCDVFTTEVVTEAIANMEDNSPGEDGLRLRLLNFLRTENGIMNFLCKGLNNASRLTLSNRAKASVTILIKKPRASGNDPANYRPIALQPVMSKLYSKCIESLIWKEIDDKNIHISDSQAGFRPCRSRYDQIFLLRCVQDHFHKQNKRVYAAFLDITKAYDSVPHVKIVECLRRAGVNGHLIRAVADLLSSRTTSIYGHTINIGRGVPQGDPLSPLLFIIQLQPLCDALDECGVGGITLPGGLLIRDLLYADDICLVAESEEDLNRMLSVCTEWATPNGMQFSVPKSEVMVLVGNDPAQLPIIRLYDSPLKWVQEFRYLGYPIFANNRHPHKHLPLDLSSIYKVVYPMASIIEYDSKYDLPVIQRAQAFVTMIEGKAMHNAQVGDLDVKAINNYINKGLKRITGLMDTTLLRCDLGVLPAELVVHRNALYFLWHLRRRAWFRPYLPSLAHLHPMQRLTSMTFHYPSLRLDMLDTTDYNEWRTIVSESIIEKAEAFYDTGSRPEYQLFPNNKYAFAYRGQKYANHRDITDLAQIALELRQDRLPVDRSLQPWTYHPCPMCHEPKGMCGRHLLQCPQLPDNLMSDRDQLIRDHYPGLQPDGFARGVIECFGAHAKESSGDPSTEFLRKNLVLGRKIAKYARRQLRSAVNSHETESSTNTNQDANSDQDDESLYDDEDTQQNTPDRNRRRLIGDITPGGLSSIAMQLCGG